MYKFLQLRIITFISLYLPSFGFSSISICYYYYYLVDGLRLGQFQNGFSPDETNFIMTILCFSMLGWMRNGERDHRYLNETKKYIIKTAFYPNETIFGFIDFGIFSIHLGHSFSFLLCFSINVWFDGFLEFLVLLMMVVDR